MIESVLVDPDLVTLDATFQRRKNYARVGALPPPHDRLYLKVCVQYRPTSPRGEMVGEIVTAFPTPKIKRGEVQRWP